MKTFLLRACACVLLVCALTACPETSVGPDFGYKPVALKPADWDGLWQIPGEDNAVRLQVTDGPNGQITFTDTAGSKDKKDKPGKPTLLTLRHAATDKDAGLYFATMREQGDTAAALTPSLIHVTDKGAFVLWMINNAAVEAAIKAGRLQGSIKRVKNDAHCRIDSVPANYALLVQPQFWEWLQPTVVTRQKK